MVLSKRYSEKKKKKETAEARTKQHTMGEIVSNEKYTTSWRSERMRIGNARLVFPTESIELRTNY